MRAGGPGSTARRGTVAAVTALALGALAAAGTGAGALAGGAPAGATPDGGWTLDVDGDGFVARPAGEPAPLTASGVGDGYTIGVGVTGYAYRDYTLTLVASPGIEQLRPDVVNAAAAIRAATGLRVAVAAGVVADRRPGPGEVMVRTASTSSCGTLAMPGIAGCGGPYTIGGAIVGGEVSVATVAPCNSRASAVVTHELGHAFGLGHYSDPYQGLLQLMYPSTDSGAPTFRAGDRAGLAAVAGVPAPLVDAPVAAAPDIAPGGATAPPTPAPVPGPVPAAAPVTAPSDATLTASAPVLSRFSQPAVQRVLDTRNGVGGPTRPFASGETRTLTLPASVVGSGIDAVALNLTVAGPSAVGFVTASPGGEPRPSTSSANYAPGSDLANLVVVKTGPAAPGSPGTATVDLYNFGGAVDLVADVLGVFGASGINGFVAADPARLLDTRRSNVPGERGFPVGCGQSVPVSPAASVVPSGAVAEIVNLTVADSRGGGFVSLTSGVVPPGTLPATSNLNLGSGAIRANLAISPGRSFWARSSDTMRADVLADLAGSFVPLAQNPLAAGLVAVSPTRLLDTRDAGPSGRLAPGQTRRLVVGAPAGVAPAKVVAVVVNLTVVDSGGAGYLSALPAGTPLPDASNVNFVAGGAVPNLAVVRVVDTGTGPAIDLFTDNGSPHVVADVMGYFVNP